MQWFLYLFPPALGGLLALTFALIPHFPRQASLAPFLAVSPWLIISPLMGRWIRKRTIRAIDTLAHNLTTAEAE